MPAKLQGGVKGVDHVAYVTWKPEETIHFYRDVLGFPLVHCILAPGWGNEPHPDFAHFFFHIGADAKMAWFYYFGQEPYSDPNVSNLLKKARHLALLVDTAEELEHYRKRLEDAGYPIRHGVPVAHEMIESIYVYDPNGYNLEFSRVLRPITEADSADTEASIEALIAVSKEPEPSLAKVWAKKGELLLAKEGSDMASLFVVKEHDFLPLADHATSPGGVNRKERKHFVEVQFEGELTVPRAATGMRHAVWYSSVAGVAGARVVQFDKEQLKLVAEA